MHGRPVRRFGLVDAMILVAATSIGLAWGRHDLVATVQAREVPLGFRSHNRNLTRPVEFADRMATFINGTSRLLACWTLSALIVRLRAPRVRRGRLLCQPGTLAVATATAYAVAVAVSFALAFLIRAKYKPTWSDYAAQAVDVHETARAITAAWIILALSGRWRPEPTWADRLGCLIGLSWIALAAAGNMSDWW